MNELQITKNEKGYDNIDLTKMKNDSEIIVTKKFAEVKEYSGEKVYAEGEKAKPWTMYVAKVVYKGVDNVGFIFPKVINTIENEPIFAEALAKAFDDTGGQDDKVKITCKKEMGEAAYDGGRAFKKGDDIVKINLAFELYTGDEE